jgi:hypothetical protein
MEFRIVFITALLALTTWGLFRLAASLKGSS